MVVFGVYDKVVDVLTLKLSAIKETSDSSSFSESAPLSVYSAFRL